MQTIQLRNGKSWWECCFISWKQMTTRPYYSSWSWIWSSELFSLVFPEELRNVLEQQTNMYIAQKQWKTWLCDKNKDEMKAFVGALYFKALHRVKNFDHYFSRDWVFAIPALQNVFTRNQFWQLRKNFHLADNTKQLPPTDACYDKLHLLPSMITGIKEKFKRA